jgi:signal transduction histidine kinase
LIEARRRAEEAVKAKQQFLSNMSHEIRTPMNAIVGFTKVVLKTDLDDKQREYINAIKISGDALIVLINDILDLAKVDAGKMTFEQIPFKLSVSLDAMLHLFETKAKEKNLKFTNQIPIKLLERIILLTTNENDVILDPFFGSGSLYFACKNTNRKCVGIEQSKEHLNIFLQRLK